ncbi:MAG: SiaC family regulatory phosphoprotein [Bacteroidia bacterium]|nr:SiaC family regulatory phosphoprotein [Bacteroidia bacterium]MDW8057154.1 SiaC family regulatory phosphoprotein [Bacteroidia bacterium]
MRLFIEGTSSRPTVLFDLEKRFLRIDGMSSMPDSAKFYTNLWGWLLSHRAHIVPGTRLVLRLLYLNSGTHKALYQFFSEIKRGNLPVVITLIRAARYDNSEETELLSQICRQVGLSYTIQDEAEMPSGPEP